MLPGSEYHEYAEYFVVRVKTIRDLDSPALNITRALEGTSRDLVLLAFSPGLV